MTIKYPSIEQFKNVIRQVKNNLFYAGKDADGNPIYVERELPTLKFTGTVKIHGTNAGIRFSKGSGELVAQSRERDLSLTSDNAGFYVFVKKNETMFSSILSDIIGDADHAVIYGEWFGQGIQKGVAVSSIQKSFAIFGVRLITGDVETWLPVDVIRENSDIHVINNANVWLINQFPTFEVDIDFSQPEMVQNKLRDLTISVEDECPVGKFFGVSGIGEGIVWNHHSDIGNFTFKTKGEKHSNSKVKTIAPVDEESFKQAKEFAENYVTQARLEQGIHVMKTELQIEPVIQNVGQFIKWVTTDVMKEEQNSIIANDLDPKKVVREVGTIARRWYMEQL